MAFCLIGLGSNLGERQEILAQAVRELPNQVGRVQAVSPLHATKPMGGPAGQADFLNAAVLCETNRAPQEVLASLHRLEDEAGRQRNLRWGARTLDLDLLLYDQMMLDEPGLRLPHPRMAFRKFVLEPASQIAGDMVHPPTQFSVDELLARLERKPIHLTVLGEQAAEVVKCVANRRSDCWHFVGPIREDSAHPDAMIEFVRRRHENWRIAATHSAILSDFWIRELDLRLKHQMSDSELLMWQAAMDGLPAQFTNPHLVIWLLDGSIGEPGPTTLQASLSAPPEPGGPNMVQASGVPPQRFAPRQSGAPSNENMDEQLCQAMFRSKQFPVLVLYGASIDAASEEVVAAIAAME